MAHMTRPRASLPLALLLIAACQPAPPLTAEPPAGGEAGTAIYGTVKLPRRLVLMPSPPAYPQPPSPLPSGAELPAIGAEVFCSDAAGTRIPGITKVKTNEDGAYRLRSVPIGYAYVVNAVYRDVDGRPLRLRTLTRVTDGPVEAPLDTATTLVAEAALAGQAGLLAGFPADAWARALKTAAAHLPPEGPTDVGDPGQLAAAIARLQAEDPAWASDVAALRAGLGHPTPAPSSMPSAGPSPTPSPAPSASPSPTATPAAAGPPAPSATP